MRALPDFTPLVAVMVADPLIIAVTSPLEFTVAFEISDDDHATAWPGSGSPVRVSATDVSCCVPPTLSVEVSGVTMTESTSIRNTSSSLDPL